MKIIALEKLNSGVDYHRIVQPLKYLSLSERDSVIELNNRVPVTESFFKDVDIVLFSRECPFNLDQILEFRSKFGFKLIIDIDDYWHLPSNHILYQSWKDNATGEQILRGVETADLVTTTHEYLRDKIYQINKNVEVLPNGLPYGHEQFTDQKVDTDNILYSCSITHLEDLKKLSRFFELCSQNQDIQKYSFCVAGFNSHTKLMKDTFDKIQIQCKKFGNYKSWSYLPLSSYMNHYTYAKISIAPLEDNEFNKCKSALKGLEAGCKNIPLLASATHPYTELPVIHCKTQKDWYTNLKELIRNPELIKIKGEILGNYVREYFDLNKINEKRKYLYQSICS